MKFGSCKINPEQVRLLLFKECDWRGRRLLFDSSAIEKVPAGNNDKPTTRKTDEAPCIVEVSDGYTYLYKGPEADATVLGEMIFGAVAMNCKSVSLKIHIMDEPRRLMCTKLFCVPVSRRISKVERKTSDRLDTSASASKPLTVPSASEGVSLSFSLDRGDSGFCGDHSPYSSVSSTYDYFSMFETWDGNETQEDFCSFHSLPGRKLSTSSNGSWQRRASQNIATRFDLGQSSQLLSLPTGNATSSDSQIYTNSSTSGTADSLASGSGVSQRKHKLGLAVLITVNDSAEMDVVRRCVEHSPQIQALVCRLRVAALSSRGGAFVSTLHRAARRAALWLSDLIYGPRLQPVWLSLVTQDTRATHRLADSMMRDLSAVLVVGDTKTTHFFVSALLTHVLTYHLGWVTTVSPYDTVDHKNSSNQRKVPYNAMWAQLGDLCGSIGYPSRAARTILSGEKNSPFINRLLVVLTYFMRCGDVTRNVFKYQDSPIDEGKTIVVTKVPVNTHSDSARTLVSEVSCERSTTLANLTRKLSSSESGGTSGLRRNHTTMHSLVASSDSSLNSTTSDEAAPEQVLFVLGDDDKLVGLKNKSNGGKSVKKSSKPNEPAEQKECVKTCAGVDSPSKCCSQTLQHSKPIKHSGFKFEFDKYPQIVTNYMKSKNLEILDRHYIGKPGNLKLDNFQFDPTVVPPIQEERCETCDKCQMEFMLQTPTNASEMEYMNDMPRALEPQYANRKLVTETDKREMSPKTFVRKRKDNTVVVNLANTKSVSDGEVNLETKDNLETVVTDVCSDILCDKGMPTIPIIKIPQISTQDSYKTGAQISGNKREHSRILKTKLKATKSLGNLNLLVPLDDLVDSPTEYSSNDDSRPRIHASDTNISSNKLKLNVSNDAKFASINELSQSSHRISKTSASSNDTLTPISAISAELNTVSSNELKFAVSSEITASYDSTTAISDEQKEISETSTSSANPVDSTISAINSKFPSSQSKLTVKPTVLELKMPEIRRTRRQVPSKTVEVRQVIEFPVPKMCATECAQAGFHRSLLGGLTDHYVPDLILQGTLAKPEVWECELRRDLDLTSYLNRSAESPLQAVAIIADTNTWEVRVVGRECGTSGMSPLVGAMLDAVHAMWKAKVPAPQCLSFVESKLREFCVISKTLADMLMSTDFCDIATLTKSLNIDVSDVPLLLAVASTHTPQVATRYGISYR